VTKSNTSPAHYTICTVVLRRKIRRVGV